MIGQLICDTDGQPVDSAGQKLAESLYQPPEIVKKLFARVQQDFQVAWSLQNRPFDEFDGYSLLQRTRMDQQLFAAYVGCEYVPKNRTWRWKGRKNTSRNKLIKILSRAIAGMLFPYVYAKNDKNEEDKMTAHVMRILIEDHLRKAGYKMKFLFMIMSALVNPAVFVEVEYLQIMQKIKRGIAGGKVEILNVVDELLSGLALNIIPIDEILLGDFYCGTGRVQSLPVIIRVQRIPWDQARGRYAGKFFDENGKDLFGFVEAGKTRVVMNGENLTLFDVEWTEADRNFVQIITAKYRSEDLEVDWVGGVGMFEYKDCYNTNPFKNRRMCLAEIEGKQEWVSIPVYNIAMSGFEPLDPAGRFAYYKSGAFKEYWDDQWLNKMDAFLYDATALDTMKPIFLSGVGKVDGTVLFPGATIGMPTGATATPYSTSPNLAATYKAVQMAKEDLGDSMNSEAVDPNSGARGQVTATEVDASVAQVKLFFTCFSLMIADLIEQIGALSMDCVIAHATVPELDYSVPEAISAKYKTFLTRDKQKGKDVTNHIVFTDKHPVVMPKQKKDLLEGKMYDANGGAKASKNLFEVNPFHFARTTYTMHVDADKIVFKSLGQDKKEAFNSFNVLSDPRIAPFTDPAAVANEMIEEFSFDGEDPDKFKKKGNGQDPMLGAIMGNNTGQPGAAVGAPKQPQQLVAQ